jgi:hypothetical protein
MERSIRMTLSRRFFPSNPPRDSAFPKNGDGNPGRAFPPARSVNGLFKTPRGALEQAIEALI